MAEYLRELPDDVFCNIFSLLPVRDAVRARSSSSRWKDLPDLRSVLQFNATNVLGKGDMSSESLAYRSKFVKAVNQFLDLWRGKKVSTLSLQFGLGNEHASHIDRWIATAIKMEVEELDLNFDYIKDGLDIYIFPSHLLSFENQCYLKHLCLRDCMLSLPFGCTSWLSCLTTLHLRCVPLDQSSLECILSAGLNLISLKLSECSLPRTLCIQLLRLKKLEIFGSLLDIELNCPNLEIFQLKGRGRNMTFSHVPILRDVEVLLVYKTGGCSSIFDDLTRSAPHLQALSLWITTEVKPVLIPRYSRCQLKKLDLLVIWTGFDLLTITYLLHASPFLQILNIKFTKGGFFKESTPGKYFDWPHFQLKEVKIERLSRSTMDLVSYLLKNAVKLEKMMVERACPSTKQEIATLNKRSPAAQVIFL